MKKHAGLILLLLHLLHPVCLAAAGVLKMEFILFSQWGYLLILTAVTIGLTCAGGKSVAAFPVTIINGICAIWFTRCLPAGICALCWCVCGGILFHRSVSKGFRRILTLAVTVPLILLLALSCPLDLFAETMGYVRTVQKSDSPDGTYTAHLIDSNSGALGGDTFIKVYDNSRTVNLLFGRFTPEPELLYRGSWGEFNDLTLLWEDDHTLTDGIRSYPLP